MQDLADNGGARRLDTFYGKLAKTLAPSTLQTGHWTLMPAFTQARDWRMLKTKTRLRPPAKPTVNGQREVPAGGQ